MKSPNSAGGAQRKFDFSPPRPRPFLSSLPAHIDTYEEGVSRFFRWRTGRDYYASIDHVVEWVLNTKQARVVDLLTDTGAFALRLAARRAFGGRIYSFDSNITLLERARQRARHMSVDHCVEFHECATHPLPVPDCSAEVVVSFFDFHRHDHAQFLAEAIRILAPDGHLLLAEVIEPASGAARWRWFWRKAHLRWVQKKPTEAEGQYPDRELLIRLLFDAGFRQVIIEGMRVPKSHSEGVFSLVVATK